jgi:phage-related protein (TIGR01555 family)
VASVADTAAEIVNPAVSAARERADGWVNRMTGLGTSRDKTSYGAFCQGRLLTFQDLTNLYTYDDLSATIVDTYPQEEMRLGFGLKGLDAQNTTEVDRYLKRFELIDRVIAARIWGRLYGGSAIWIQVNDGLDPAEPLVPKNIRSVLGLRVVDCRWLIPETFYQDGPGVGDPETYRLQEPHPGGTGSTLGIIHESRLVIFPGERTETLEKIRRRGWDLSVLVKPYEALRSSGETWKAIELLVVDANQGVYSVEELWEKVGGDAAQSDPSESDPTGGGSFLKRVQIMDRVKSVFRAIVLDKDRESYTRQTQTFTGLPEISDRAWRRVAAASRIPVPILQGENPAGLNATGTLQLQWFYAKTDQGRTQIVEPRLLRVIKILLSAQDAPAINVDETDSDADAVEDVDPLDKIGLVWLPLWAPTASELADIQLKMAQEAQIYIAQQVLLPEEVAMSLPEGRWKFDRDIRKASLEEDAATMLRQKNEAKIAQGEAAIAGSKAAKETAENPPDPNAQPAGAPPAPGAKPGAPPPPKEKP